MEFLLFIFKAAASAVVGWIVTKFLAVLGADEWIVIVAQWLRISIDRRIAFWGSTCVLSVMLYFTAGFYFETWRVPYANNHVAPATNSPAVSSTQVALPRQPSPAAHPVPKDQPITWTFEQERRSGKPTSLFAIASGSGGYWIVAYEISGQNNTDERLTNVVTYVVPKNTNEKIPLKLKQGEGIFIEPQKSRGIPEHFSFVLRGDIKIPNDSRELPALSVEEYLEKYGGFKFVFEYDEGPPQSYEFPYSEIKTMLMNEKEENRRANLPRPRIESKD